MDEIVCFLVQMIRLTEEDLRFQRDQDPEDPWTRFLEGKLLAFRITRGYVEDLLRKSRELQ